LDVDKIRTSPYKAATNGTVERYHRTLNSMLAKVVSQTQRDWDDHLPFVVAAYRASPHSATGLTPNHIIFGRENIMPLDLVMGPAPGDESTPTPIPYCQYVDELKDRMETAYRMAREHLGLAAERRKVTYDARVRHKDFEVNSWVWYHYPRRYAGKSQKWQRVYSGPFLIIRKIPPSNFVIQKSARSQPQVVHTDKLKQCHGETPKSWLLPQPTDETAEDGDVHVPVTTPETPVQDSDQDDGSPVGLDEANTPPRRNPSRTRRKPDHLNRYYH
jgi:hypothetical protein